MRIVALITTLVLAFLAGSAQAASVYKWVDEQGQVHYGEKPPSADADELNVRPVPNVDADLEARRARQDKLLRAYEEERAVKMRQQEEDERRRAERKRQCRRVQAELENTRNASGVYERDANGEKRYLSQEERRHYEARLQADVKRYCK